MEVQTADRGRVLCEAATGLRRNSGAWWRTDCATQLPIRMSCRSTVKCCLRSLPLRPRLSPRRWRPRLVRPRSPRIRGCPPRPCESRSPNCGITTLGCWALPGPQITALGVAHGGTGGRAAAGEGSGLGRRPTRLQWRCGSARSTQAFTARSTIIITTATAGLPGTGPVRIEGQGATGVADVDLAYDYAGDVYNFYLNNHGRDSLDGAGMQLISTVRYCDPDPTTACPYDNAFWNGEQMVYGAGLSGGR